MSDESEFVIEGFVAAASEMPPYQPWERVMRDGECERSLG